MNRLLTLDEAADRLGVPKRGLRKEAEAHGFLVRVGRVVRLQEDKLEELMDRCRVKPQEQDCTADPTRVVAETTKSATAEDASARALQTAERLRKSTRATSRNGAAPQPAPVIPLTSS